MKRWLHCILRKAMIEVWTVQWENRLTPLEKVSMTCTFKKANWMKFAIKLYLQIYKHGYKCLYYVRL